MNTFTVQTVHGIEETFIVGPGGKIDTTSAYRNRPASDQRHAESAGGESQVRINDPSRS